MYLGCIIVVLLLQNVFLLKVFKLKISSPAVLFTIGFTLAGIVLATMYEVWPVGLNQDTFIVITFGTFFFSLGCFISIALAQYRSRGVIDNKQQFFDEKNYRLLRIIENRKIIFVFLLFNLISILFYVIAKVNIAHQYGQSGSILYLMGYVSDLEKLRAESVHISSVITLAYAVCRYSGYVWGMLFLDLLFENDKVDKLLLGCFLTSVVAWFLTGSRADGVSMIIGMVLYGIIKNRETQKFKIRIRTIFLFFLAVIVFVFLFDYYARVTKRIEDDYGLWENIAIYVGAPILNLDSVFRENIQHSEIFGEKTFNGLYTLLENRLGIEILPIVTMASKASEYRSYRGHTLGNVYTIFNPLIKDFYVVGAMIFTLLLGFVTETFHLEANKRSRSNLSILTMMYIYTAPTIFLSFFANKFAQTVFNADFLHGFLAWIAIIFILKKVKV